MSHAARRAAAIAAAAVVFAAVAVLLAACGSDAGAASTGRTGDGWRTVAETPAGVRVLARCDGSTLLYVTEGYPSGVGGSVAVVQGAGECAQ